MSQTHLARRATLAFALIAALIVAASGAPACAGSVSGDGVEIHKPIGIDEAAFVTINGLDQWITIRGQDRSKPVVLILHGGPGQAQSHLIQRMAPMEEAFVVVQWDQRGAGRTLAHAGGMVDPALDLTTMVMDGLAVTDFVRLHLHRKKILLLGFSWGSRLGVEIAQAAPASFAAYVGTGQAAEVQPKTDAWVYQHLVDRAQQARDAQALADLAEAGPPPWSSAAGRKAYQVSAPYRGAEVSVLEGAKAAFTAPHWTAADVQALSKGRSAYKDTQLERDIAAFDPARFGQSLALPVIVIEGADDLTTPAPFAQAWLQRLKAPKKAFIALPGAGHQALVANNAAFTAALIQELATLHIPAT